MALGMPVQNVGNVVDVAERLRESWHKGVKTIKVAPYGRDTSWDLGRVNGLTYALALIFGISHSEMTQRLTAEHDDWCAARIH